MPLLIKYDTIHLQFNANNWLYKYLKWTERITNFNFKSSVDPVSFLLFRPYLSFKYYKWKAKTHLGEAKQDKLWRSRKSFCRCKQSQYFSTFSAQTKQALGIPIINQSALMYYLRVIKGSIMWLKRIPSRRGGRLQASYTWEINKV